VLCTGSTTHTSWAGLGTKCKFKTDSAKGTGLRYRIKFYGIQCMYSSRSILVFITFQIVLLMSYCICHFSAVTLKTYWRNNTYWKFIQNKITFNTLQCFKMASTPLISILTCLAGGDRQWSIANINTPCWRNKGASTILQC
jgi:hypothetical protein